MFVHVDPTHDLAIYDQIVRQIKFSVAHGAVAHEPVVVDGGGKRDRLVGADLAELDDVTFQQIVGFVQIPGADGRAGEIEEDGDVGVPPHLVSLGGDV